MTTIVAHNADIKVEPELPTGNSIGPAPSPAGGDISSPSPPNSELFDRNAGDRSWQRYGSLESGASTGITSVCSSMTNDEPTQSPLKKQKLMTPVKTKILLKATAKKPSPAKVSPPEDFRARSSIPSSIPAGEFAGQCIEAAAASRLDAYSLHEGEHRLLVNKLTGTEVTVYLNIRNAILRLWYRNPLCRVTIEEAAGCAKDARYFGLARFAHDWLSRNGHINFGCVHHDQRSSPRLRKDMKQRTIVVIGAGVSGLTTARQLENHFTEDAAAWLERGERPPRVIVIEGRKRIGGRVYSKPLRSQTDREMPGHLRNTAEMGAMIVTGFERGNPLDTVIRGQLGLHYHMLRDSLTIYDCDGRPVDEKKDMLNTDLYTDISDRTGDFRAAPRQSDTLKGDEDLINRCRDPTSSIATHFQLEPLQDFDPQQPQRKPVSKRGRRVNAPPGTEKLTGRSQIVGQTSSLTRAARAAHEMGWKVRDGMSKNHTVSLRALAESHDRPSLGNVMDAAIMQYQGLLEMDAQDMRLLNWHHANLEYANAAPVGWLSLSGHDQDNGNEFEGAHSEIVGGYTQLPRGLMTMPTKLDVRFDHVVQQLHYSENDTTAAKIVCTNGATIEADQVIMTVPLGVLKSDMISFHPPLPDWKRGAINNMGFGLLNKVILVYDKPFWDESRDMFGLLNDAEEWNSLSPRHYERRRGRFYLIWNASKISGRPMLMALMAGHAAYDCEVTDTATLLEEITQRLRAVFATPVPRPREVIVTRWRQDPFSRGTYSYVAPCTQPGDYDLMARSTGNLHFAGEATCGTHPATVHGAFLSGLRAASVVLESMLGPVELPSPLISARGAKLEEFDNVLVRPVQSPSLAKPAAASMVKPAAVAEIPKYYYGKKPSGPPQKSVCPGDPSYWISMSLDRSNSLLEARIQSVISAEIGQRPVKPSRTGVNPFLLYSRDKWDECKAATVSPGQKINQNHIRQTLGQQWKTLGDEARQPYLDRSKAAQDATLVEQRQWKIESDTWDSNATRLRGAFMETYHAEMHCSEQEAASGGRKTNVSTNIALDSTALS